MSAIAELVELPMAAALNQALDEALAEDPRVFLLGEDIVDPAGGTMQVTKGLSTKYGRERVRETPISEQAIIGAAIGAAMAGMRPVAEIMIMDFIAVCADQLVNHAAKLRFMSGGRTQVPLTVRCLTTGGFQMAAQHSQSLEAWLAHTPGLKVAVPSNAADAKGLLTACIADDDPCILIEPAGLYGIAGPVPAGHHVVPLGSAAVQRPGRDVTLISWGKPVLDCLAVAEQLDGDVDVEIIDLRTIVPLDTTTLLESVCRTKRAVIVHQAVRRCGFGAEIAALLQEELHGTLVAPVLRVAGKDTPVPYAGELESYHLPSVADIVDAVRTVVK